MTEEYVTIDPVVVPLKKRYLFEDAEKIIAKIVDAQWIQGKFSPGVAVDFKTLHPQIGASLRATCYLSTRKDDGSYFVGPGGPLDKLQQAVLSDEEFFMMDSVSPETWIGRPVVFEVELVEYETESGEPRKTNYVQTETFRSPTEEELEMLRKTLGASRVLSLQSAQQQASEAKAITAPSQRNGGEVEVDESDFENLDF